MQGIVEWLEAKTGPPALEINDVDAFNNIKETKEVFVIGCFKNKETGLAKEFLNAADKIEAVKVLITSNDDVIKHIEGEDNSIILLKKFDDPKLIYAGEPAAQVRLTLIPIPHCQLIFSF